MKKLKYSIKINANKAHVWNILLEPGKYEQWVKAFSEGSRFEGRWKQGATVRFVDPNMGGLKAILEIFDPPFIEMFDSCWPTAFENIKLLPEDQSTENV